MFSFKNTLKYFTIFLCIFLITDSSAQIDSSYKIIIVAGQSNTLNWHSAASEINTLVIDEQIPFYYHCGAPPDRGFDVPFNVTSNGLWETLKTQTQDPYIALEKDFFGPEITLARSLYEEYGNIAVIKCAYFGTNLAKDWDPEATSGNQLYKQLFDQLNLALPKDNQGYWINNIIGFFWMQGESDASKEQYANDYQTNLTNFIETLRNDLQNQQLKVVLGRIGSQLPPPYVHKEIVRTAQVNVADNDPLVEWVDTDDLPLDTDNVHHIAAGTKLLGIRWAEAFLNLVTDIQTVSEKKPDKKLQTFPNPSNNATTIVLPYNGHQETTISIYSVTGELLFRDEVEVNHEHYTYQLNSSFIHSGVYIVTAQNCEKQYTAKMIVIK